MNKHTFFFSSLIVIVSILLYSCATILSGTTDSVTINSIPEGATIIIDGIDYGKTPATIVLKRPGLNDKIVVLKLEGYEDRTFTLQKEFNTVAILNLGSIFGWAIDILTGSINKYNPVNYKFELKKSKSSYNLEDLKRDSYGRINIPNEDIVKVIDERKNLVYIFSK